MTNENEYIDIYSDAECKYVRNNLREIRAKLGMSQQELADQTGMKQTFILKLEKQQANFTAATLIKCARVLNCALSDILCVDLPENSFSDKAIVENVELKKKLEDIQTILNRDITLD